MKRASVSDVSRRAGVSTATVSRVLNDPDKVLPRTREKVLAAIEELNFVKSATAFSLKAQRSHNVLVVVSDIGNTYYSKLLQSVLIRAEENGYNVIITSRESGQHDTVLDRLRTGRVDGVVFLDGYSLSAEDFAFLRTFYLGTPPIVGFAEKPGLLPYPHVFVDNFTPVYELTRYLIGLGHKRIGFIEAPSRLPVRLERLDGFRQAMCDAGLEICETDILEGGFTSDVGQRVAASLLERGNLPTAVMCSNDDTAMGLISTMVEAGIAVPEALSVVGFDDCTLADVYSPPLTTVAQPREQIGKTAMDILFRIMADVTTPLDTVVTLETEMRIRGSAAPPRAD
jgi:LacI family repressor for deo operon, udp, cdd, tsx, nupC, and nupG